MFPPDYFPPTYFADRYWPQGVGGDEPDPPLAECGTDLMSRGAAWFATALPAVAGQPVIYQRGHRKVAFCATVGRTLLQLDSGDGGIRMEWTDRDYLIPRTSLVIAGNAVTPERGDIIKERKSGILYTYEVHPYGAGEAPWRWSDPFRNLLRIHCKLIDQVPV